MKALSLEDAVYLSLLNETQRWVYAGRKTWYLYATTTNDHLVVVLNYWPFATVAVDGERFTIGLKRTFQLRGLTRAYRNGTVAPRRREAETKALSLLTGMIK